MMEAINRGMAGGNGYQETAERLFAIITESSGS
jgi:hypothetical protein